MTHAKASLVLPKPYEIQPNPAYECHHFGPETASFIEVQMSQINIAGQMRDKASFKDDGDLKESIQATGLLNPFIVYEMTEETARSYVSLTNKGFDAEVDFAEYQPNQNGNYYILIAGERRYRSIEEIAAEQAVSPSDISLTVQVRECEKLIELMKVQTAENIYKAPPPDKYAAILHEIYLLGLESGEYVSQSDFIKDSPAGRKTTKNAMLFFDLPPSIRSIVSEGHIPYYHAIDMHPYVMAYKDHLDNTTELSDSEKLALLERNVIAKINHHIASGSKRSELQRNVAAWVESLGYFQTDLGDIMRSSAIEQHEVEERKIIQSRRDNINALNRQIRSITAGLAFMRQFDEATFSAVHPNVRTNLEELSLAVAELKAAKQEHIRGALVEVVANLEFELNEVVEEDEIQTLLDGNDDDQQNALFT